MVLSLVAVTRSNGVGSLFGVMIRLAISDGMDDMIFPMG